MIRRRVAHSVPQGSRSAVVTGGGGGIGAAVARELAGRGYRVLVTDVDGDTAAKVAAEVGGESLVQDVTDPEAARATADRARRLAPLGAWVANAGLGTGGPLADLSDAQARTLVEVNVLGVVWSARAAIDAFRAQGGGGELAITASLSGLGPVPGLSLYAATKAAVLSLAQSLSDELRADRIRVHAINPDGVATALLSEMEPRARELVRSGVLLTPEQVATELVGMFGTSRVVRTVPTWRGVMMRTSTLAPSTLLRATPVLQRLGARNLAHDPGRTGPGS
ncbi:SDR family oxidoreductase [Pseudonocardia xishanensis]|uniref:SDR family NAD(P)-dependent oxidoreductase n=1 Tax=Pseudonocardia xishanensis TaxID=630995 RepID=UPI0031F159A6